MSFFRIELLRDDFTPFIGFRNYAVRLAADSEFLATLPLTVAFAVLTSALAVPIALATAVLIDGRGRFSGALAVVLLLPWAIAPIADGILWRLMFEPRTGLVTFVLSQLGLPTVVVRDAVGTIVAMAVAVHGARSRSSPSSFSRLSGGSPPRLDGQPGSTAPPTSNRSGT